MVSQCVSLCRSRFKNLVSLMVMMYMNVLVLSLLFSGASSCAFAARRKLSGNESHLSTARQLTPKCMLLDNQALAPTKAGICAAYHAIKSDFENNIVTISDLLQRSDIYGAAVRICFHDAAEADITQPNDFLGPDGCLSDSSDNAGLVETTSPIVTVLQPIWEKNCNRISLADFWVLFAKLVIEASDLSQTVHIKYQYGRKDAISCVKNADGRLPFPQRGLAEMERVFVTQLGLSMDDAVSLMGAHTLGHVHIASSGYGFLGDLSDGLLNAWDDTPDVFDNHYFSNLKDRNWRNELASIDPKNQWSRFGSGTIMLNSDMVLAFDANITSNVGRTGQVCGPTGATSPQGVRGFGCSPNNSFMPATCDLVCAYIADNALFLRNFAEAFAKMTTVGYGLPADEDGATATGKLGTLTAIDLDSC